MGDGKLERIVELATRAGNDAALPLAMLTLQPINKDQSLERKAQRIINHCYKSAFDESENLGVRIENLYTAVTCCDYVTRFSIRKVAALWNELTFQVLATNTNLTPRQVFQLIEIAKECEQYADIHVELQSRLHQMLNGTVQNDSLEAEALNEIAKRGF